MLLRGKTGWLVTGFFLFVSIKAWSLLGEPMDSDAFLLVFAAISFLIVMVAAVRSAARQDRAVLLSGGAALGCRFALRIWQPGQDWVYGLTLAAAIFWTLGFVVAATAMLAGRVKSHQPDSSAVPE